MAEKRMFNISIIDSDMFLSMPLSSQALYFHLAMRADDDGFVNNPKKIMRMIGANEGDIEQLVSKRYIICFESGVIVIKHWRIHNYIQNDRYHKTNYQDELSQLELKDNKSYTERKSLGKSTIINPYLQSESNMDTICIQPVSKMEAQIRLDKISIDKNRIDKSILPGAESSAPDRNQSEPIFKLPLNDKTNFPIYEADIKRYEELYPAVDIMQDLRNMLGWLEAKPNRKKTRNGIKAFITTWLSKTQNQGGTKGYDGQSNCISENDKYTDDINAGGIIIE